GHALAVGTKQDEDPGFDVLDGDAADHDQVGEVLARTPDALVQVTLTLDGAVAVPREDDGIAGHAAGVKREPEYVASLGGRMVARPVLADVLPGNAVDDLEGASGGTLEESAQDPHFARELTKRRLLRPLTKLRLALTGQEGTLHRASLSKRGASALPSAYESQSSPSE